MRGGEEVGTIGVMKEPTENENWKRLKETILLAFRTDLAVHSPDPSSGRSRLVARLGVNRRRVAVYHEIGSDRVTIEFEVYGRGAVVLEVESPDIIKALSAARERFWGSEDVRWGAKWLQQAIDLEDIAAEMRA